MLATRFEQEQNMNQKQIQWELVSLLGTENKTKTPTKNKQKLSWNTDAAFLGKKQNNTKENNKNEELGEVGPFRSHLTLNLPKQKLKTKKNQAFKDKA